MAPLHYAVHCQRGLILIASGIGPSVRVNGRFKIRQVLPECTGPPADTSVTACRCVSRVVKSGVVDTDRFKTSTQLEAIEGLKFTLECLAQLPADPYCGSTTMDWATS